MITILRNSNFSNWFDVRIFGELIDNAASEVSALRIAKRIKRKEHPTAIIKIIDTK